ncbi:MAG TPA: type I polyketide synthase, partial [Actinocrinis sp.]|uniref:type I polyketide synthase n=1 Tax=Actinocrinis sp. TaxID=1920516 RepID=UPI002DDD8D58
HTQAAAGAAGVIKMVLALQHAVVPATLHVDAPSPHIDWTSGAVELAVRTVPWPQQDWPRRAGVSSFGISGTNAHVILEQAPDSGPSERGDERAEPDDERGLDALGLDAANQDTVNQGTVTLNTVDLNTLDLDAAKPDEQAAAVLAWPLSASSAAGLRGQAARLRRFVAENPSLSPADAGWSLASARAQLTHRAVVLASDRDGFESGLAALERDEPTAATVSAVTRGRPRVAFVFPGQGGQWPGMAAELLDTSPVFAERIQECEQALSEFVDWSLTAVLRQAPGAPSLDRVDVVQPTLFAVMVSLAGLWRHYGVEPAAVVGHSQGEIAAAYVAGGLSLRDAAQVVAMRSAALTALPAGGGMASVQLGREQIQQRLSRWGDRLEVAAVNSPSQVVVSGDGAALDELVAECAAAGVRARRIEVDYAAHSAQVEQLRESLLTDLGAITPRTSQVPFYSAVTAGLLDTARLDAEYWYQNLRQPVQFEAATRALRGRGFGVFVETSPHPVLAIAVADAAELAEDAAEPVAVGSLRRGEGGLRRFVASLAEAWTAGVQLDWSVLFGPAAQLLPLPAYAFDRQRFWLEDPRAATADPAALGVGATGHPLLGAEVTLADGTGTVLTGRLSARAQPWLSDHAVAGVALLPGTGFVELALRAADEVGCPQIEELTLEAPLVLPDEDTVQVQLSVGPPDGAGRRPLAIYARSEQEAGLADSWTRHASGTLAAVRRELNGEALHLREWPPPGAVPVPVDPAEFYREAQDSGYTYGPAFQGLRAAWRRGGEVFAEVALPEPLHDEAGRYGLHPALLDAAFQAMLLGAFAADGPMDGAAGEGPAAARARLPFALSGVSLLASGATALRVYLSPAGTDAVRVAVADGSGRPVAIVDRLVSRPVDPDRLNAVRGGSNRALLRVDWTALPDAAASLSGQWAMLGDDPLDMARQLRAAGASVTSYPDVTAVAGVVAAGAAAPDTLVLSARGAAGLPDAVHELTAAALLTIQSWLADERLARSRLVVVTRSAVDATGADEIDDLAAASVWGLVRSAQAEHPGRLVLVDLAAADTSPAALGRALTCGEPQVAIREDRVLIPRLAPADPRREALVPPADGPWRLETDGSGVLEGLSLVPWPQAGRRLERGEVRVRVRAAGLNFRDVLVALGVYPGEAFIGNEGAGVVLETGPGVTGVKPGDRVMGMLPQAFGPLAVTDHRWLVPMPPQWSYEQAATVPTAFLTAYYALARVAAVRAGERVLVHAAAGGVGMAAVQIARHLGAEVYATASPAKHDVLRAMGLDDDHIASSRDPQFAGRVLAATAGVGVDVVLNSLVGELTDASLSVLPRGGRFVELGKADLRDPDQVTQAHPAVMYQAIDLVRDADAELLHSMLAEITALARAGALRPLPVRATDVRQARQAFRTMSQGRHTGKLVLTMPRLPDPSGTVLVTGGTGTLGALVARHLVSAWGVRHLILASRRGEQAPGAADLRAQLRELGASVRVAACDVADRAALAALLAAIPGDHPLTGIVHTAGQLDDGVVTSLTAQQMATVLRPKADAAVHLDELTRDADLGMFVLFSAAGGVIGNPGQGNYSAANAFLDALAANRRARGQAATSIAWGLWAPDSGMTGRLVASDRDRLARSGAAAMPAEQALALFDDAVRAGEPLLVAARLDARALRAQARQGTLPAVLRGLVRVPIRPTLHDSAGAGQDQPADLAQRLAAATGAERQRMLLNLVRTHAAAVLGHESTVALEGGRGFLDLGFDSLTAVELRNRLAAATGLRLSATLAFDFPSPVALAHHLRDRLSPDVSPDEQTDGRGGSQAEPTAAQDDADIAAIDDMDLEELIRAVHGDDDGLDSPAGRSAR